MKQYVKLFCTLIVLSIGTTNNAYSQIGGGLYLGLTNSSFSNNNSEQAKGGTGFEIGFMTFAKYSEWLEWSCRVGYAGNKMTLPAYVMDYSTFGFTKYNEVATFNTHHFNFSYELSFYAVPDIFAITGGLNLAIGSPKFDYDDKYEVVLSPIDLTPLYYNNGTATYQQAMSVKAGVVSYGPTIGASFTIAERFVIYGKYVIFMNKYFDADFSPEMEDYIGNISLRSLRFGIAYKSLPSAKDRRF